MIRAVIYARYSSENQRDASIEDQIEVCRRYAKANGWKIVRQYDDRALSGGSAFRPGFQKLLADLDGRHFDVVVVEALDRLGRKLSDVASLHDQLEFRGIHLHAVNLGRVSTMHVGLLGTMAQLFLSDLKEKTKRGQLGRALAGKIPGGKAFGYDLINGKSGDRSINPAEAAVVQRIFEEFAGGKSPRGIARSLNEDSVAGPDGRPWLDTTIRGQLDRGTGILNNSLYVGRIEWNRCSYVKDPRTGKRQARPNPPEKWEIVPVPGLQIVDDILWKRVKERQLAVRLDMARQGEAPLNAAHRQRYLLSGLLVCGICGRAYTVVGRDRYGCATHRSQGTCSNTRTITRHEAEKRVLDGLKSRLMDPALLKAFIEEYHAEANRLAGEQAAGRGALLARVAQADRRIAGIMKAIEDGKYNPALTDRLTELEHEKSDLNVRLESETQPAPVRFHPKVAEVYERKIAELEKALNDPALRDEAGAVMRSLIDRIEIHPRNDEGTDLLLAGALAGILALTAAPGTKKLPDTGVSGSLLSVVAGTRNQRWLRLTSTWVKCP